MLHKRRRLLAWWKMTRYKARITNTNGAGKIDVLINEYRVMRSEIGLYQQQQNQAINFSIIASASVMTLVSQGVLSSNSQMLSSIALLVLPIFTLISGLLYVDRTMRISRIGRYIHNILRVQLIELCGGYDVLLWESCKRVLIEDASFLQKVAVWALERVRITMFILLFGIPLVVYAMIDDGPLLAWSGVEGVKSGLLCLNVAVFLVFLLTAFGYEETRGAASDASLVKKVLKKSAEQRGLPT